MSSSNTSESPTTVFSTLPGYFPSLVHPSNQKIKTDEFLSASRGVVVLVEKFGKVFTPVTLDMNGNIEKIKKKYEENETEYQFIEDMMLHLKSSGDLMAVEALQWLRRGHHFISRFFQLVIDDTDSHNNTQELGPFIKTAYRETLERYHGWLGSQLFNILSRFSPSRRHLFHTLAFEKEGKEQEVLRDMRAFNQGMIVCVQKLLDFYQEHDLETHNRV